MELKGHMDFIQQSMVICVNCHSMESFGPLFDFGNNVLLYGNVNIPLSTIFLTNTID